MDQISSMSTSMKVGFLGCGRLSSSIIEGFLNQGVLNSDQIAIADWPSAKSFALSHKIPLVSPDQMAKDCNIIFLGVKPKVLLENWPAWSALKGPKCWVSLAAGVSLADLKQNNQGSASVVRVMTNIACEVGQGVSFVWSEDETQKGRVQRLFESLGSVFQVGEDQAGQVTAATSSGIALALESCVVMSNWLSSGGLDSKLCDDLMLQTFKGALILAKGSDMKSVQNKVASPGGITQAALAELRSLDSQLAKALQAALACKK